MIGTDEFLGGAVVDAAELNAAVGAAIDDDVDRAGLVPHRDHLLGAELAALEVAGPGDFRFQADIEPARAFEDALLLERENLRVGVDPSRDARHPFFRPSQRGARRRRRSSPVC